MLIAIIISIDTFSISSEADLSRVVQSLPRRLAHVLYIVVSFAYSIGKSYSFVASRTKSHQCAGECPEQFPERPQATAGFIFTGRLPILIST
jgi:hypothetical protein